jgi:hypothetical protein
LLPEESEATALDFWTATLVSLAAAFAVERPRAAVFPLLSVVFDFLEADLPVAPLFFLPPVDWDWTSMPHLFLSTPPGLACRLSESPPDRCD